ncbi:MAG: hypothetical protein R8G66_25180 [Cytophagales bacterium]|nr:hypothetical protein [Cytophagales bacterium]
MQRLIIGLIAILFFNWNGPEEGKKRIQLNELTKDYLQNTSESHGFESYQVFQCIEDDKKTLNVELITTGELPMQIGEEQSMVEELGNRVFKALAPQDRQEYESVVVWFVEDHDLQIVKNRYAEA